jgi:Holliday junction resolvase RusA-like endonuclease
MRLVIDVSGVQPSTIKSGPTAWRTAITARARDLYPDAPYTPAEGTTFKVEVEFRLVQQRLFTEPNWPPPPDLDNLLKPVLDTVFTSDNVVGPTAALVDRNDTYVSEVCAKKRRAETTREEGAVITVAWND